MSDSLRRQWLLLRAIPRFPHRRSTAELQRHLADEGHNVNIRSIQRDLNDLSASWGFTNDLEGRTNYWYWPEGFGVLDVPGLDPSQALVLHMARQYLGKALPGSQLRHLAPYFDQADRVLGSEAQKLTRWRDRVRIITRGPGLEVPDVGLEILDAVHEALMKARVLHLSYRRRGETEPREYDASIHALVLKDGVIYGVVTFRRYTDLSHIALHRIVEARVVDQPATRLAAFNIDEYLNTQEGFAYPAPDAEKLALHLRMRSDVAEHLLERPLAADQQVASVEKGHTDIKASVLDTQELRWWLLGFGDAVQVLGPARLRKELRALVLRMAEHYRQ